LLKSKIVNQEETIRRRTFRARMSKRRVVACVSSYSADSSGC